MPSIRWNGAFIDNSFQRFLDLKPCEEILCVYCLLHVPLEHFCFYSYFIEASDAGFFYFRFVPYDTVPSHKL